MLSTDHLPAPIDRAIRLHLQLGHSVKEALRYGCEDLSPEVVLDAKGTPQLVWWPAGSEEIECRRAARRSRKEAGIYKRKYHSMLGA